MRTRRPIAIAASVLVVFCLFMSGCEKQKGAQAPASGRSQEKKAPQGC